MQLANANSLFEVAFGVSAIGPMLVSEFQKLRERAADSILRNIQRVRPTFVLAERDRPEFINFVIRSIPGLRRAWVVAWLPCALAVTNCIVSLGLLVWSAVEPTRTISDWLAAGFVADALVVAPVLYHLRGRYLAWLYAAIITHGDRGDASIAAFSHCADIYVEAQRTWAAPRARMDELRVQADWLVLRMRFAVLRMQVRQAIGAIKAWIVRRS